MPCALENPVEIKALEKFNRPDEGLGIFDRHMVDIPRIKFFAQRPYRANRSFVDGHYLASVNIDQTQMDRDRNRLRSVYRLKFMHNVVDMVINRSFADTQDYGNVP